MLLPTLLVSLTLSAVHAADDASQRLSVLESGRAAGRSAGLEAIQAALGPEEALVALPDAGDEALWITTTSASPFSTSGSWPDEVLGAERWLVSEGPPSPVRRLEQRPVGGEVAVDAHVIARLPSATQLVTWRGQPTPPRRPVAATARSPRNEAALQLAARWPEGGRAAVDDLATERWLVTRLPGVGLWLLDVPRSTELTAADGGDGLLTPDELSRLPLASAVVVAVQPPEAPEAFVVAARTAGALAVVAPLSPVQDRAASAYLDTLTHQLAAGRDVGDAHAAALQAAPEAGQAYVLFGDPRARPLPGARRSGARWCGFGGAVLLLGLVAAARWRRRHAG